MALADKALCITGTHSVTRGLREARIVANGGTTTAGVIGSTTHLLASLACTTGTHTAKFRSAEKKGIAIVLES